MFRGAVFFRSRCIVLLAQVSKSYDMTEQPTFHTSHVAFQLFLNSLQGYLQRNNILISVTAMQLAILITELPQVSVELNPT